MSRLLRERFRNMTQLNCKWTCNYDRFCTNFDTTVNTGTGVKVQLEPETVSYCQLSSYSSTYTTYPRYPCTLYFCSVDGLFGSKFVQASHITWASSAFIKHQNDRDSWARWSDMKRAVLILKGIIICSNPSTCRWIWCSFQGTHFSGWRCQWNSGHKDTQR